MKYYLYPVFVCGKLIKSVLKLEVEICILFSVYLIKQQVQYFQLAKTFCKKGKTATFNGNLLKIILKSFVTVFDKAFVLLCLDPTINLAPIGLLCIFGSVFNIIQYGQCFKNILILEVKLSGKINLIINYFFLQYVPHNLISSNNVDFILQIKQNQFDALSIEAIQNFV